MPPIQPTQHLLPSIPHPIAALPPPDSHCNPLSTAKTSSHSKPQRCRHIAADRRQKNADRSGTPPQNPLYPLASNPKNRIIPSKTHIPPPIPFFPHKKSRNSLFFIPDFWPGPRLGAMGMTRHGMGNLLRVGGGSTMRDLNDAAFTVGPDARVSRVGHSNRPAVPRLPSVPLPRRLAFQTRFFACSLIGFHDFAGTIG